MKNVPKRSRFASLPEQIPIARFLLKWLLLAILVGIPTGSASAFFLVSLDWVTNLRENTLWLIALLPVGGFLIGYIYHKLGKTVEGGNNQLLLAWYRPDEKIPFKMAPMVLGGTLLTHLLGGSAGREGTAVQMGGAIADQAMRLFRFPPVERKMLLVMGISAGFASVFGTPLAGAIFALEVLVLGRMRYEALLPSLMAAFIADKVCTLWEVSHTHYYIYDVPDFGFYNMGLTLVAGILFGLTAMLFAKSTKFSSSFFKRNISYPPLRPFAGGSILALTFFLVGGERYLGLGIPVIQEAFETSVLPYDFILKIAFTALTLGAGFKGGEVTPLFFIGATLGNVLVWFLPLPMPLLAGMGFVAVFAGATNTPIACTLMGIELFGAQAAPYLALACVVAYFFSGHTGIYEAQVIGSPKHIVFSNLKSRSIGK
jgi:H+/Cl- antiporter ClcA